MREKYNSNYFLNRGPQSHPIPFGVEGISEFLRGDIRKQDKDILKRLDFKGKSVLEFGFGRGEAIKFAAENGANRIVGVDFSEDAYDIAQEFLAKYGIKAEMYCDDAFEFLKAYLANNSEKSFDIVLMLDFVEHVPRSELIEMLRLMHNVLSDHAIIAINTPIFKADNDVISEGLKLEARDTSDDFEETYGMHCNRYTKESLEKFMKDYGFQGISGHFFIPQSPIVPLEGNSQEVWSEVFKMGYPIQPSWEPDRFEQAYLSDYYPEWHLIKGGILKGRTLFIDPKDSMWQKEMIDGNFDQFFYDYLKQFNLDGKVVFDIGAHIGYHSMQFAQLVGKIGAVYAFEPNKHNQERMKIILSNNTDLMNRIYLYDVAISDNVGEIDFHFGEEVDSGKSSGSFINNADTPLEIQEYESSGFESVRVKTVSIDQLSYELGIDVAPFLIKMDVEGSEHLILKGARNLIRYIRPIILIEIHTLSCMIEVNEILSSLNYRIEMLKHEKGGRCFIAAKPTNSAEVNNNQLVVKEYLAQLNHEFKILQREHQALQREHQALQQEHHALQQSKAVIFARGLGKYPFLLKVASAVYRVLAKIYSLFKKWF